jgi:hypothetical protein
VSRVVSRASHLFVAALLAACSGGGSGDSTVEPQDSERSGDAWEDVAADLSRADLTTTDSVFPDSLPAEVGTGEVASDVGVPDVAAADLGPADMAAPDLGTEDLAAPDTAGDTQPTDVSTTDPATPDVEPADSGTDAAAPFMPDPIPDIGEDLPAPCQAAVDDDWYFQFLDNLCNEKVYPTNQDRDRVCPTTDDSPFMTLADGTVVEYTPASSPVQFDQNALNGILPSGIEIAVILIKRVNGVPHYRYIGNGTQYTALQPWSTTKFLAAANAAATLRIESGYKVGLTASVGGTKLGDLVTSVCNYDNNPYSSNSLGAYFHNIGGRNKANALIHEDWLDRPAGESFGGNYGEAAPGLGYTFVEAGGDSVTIAKDTVSGIPNKLSMYTLAEALKRLALHMDEPSQRLPGIQWKDVKVLFYGAEGSAKYGIWGGMSNDTAIYLQMGHDIAYIEERSHGQWTIFSKLGLGSDGQFVHVGHACWPVLDDEDNPVPGWGREFVIAAHLETGGGSWKGRDRLLAETYRKIIIRIVNGSI